MTPKKNPTTPKVKSKPTSNPSIKKTTKPATPKVTVTAEDLRETRYFVPRKTLEEDIERISYGIKK